MTFILGLPFAFKQAGLMEGAFVLTLVAAGSVKAMLLLIECKYKCLSVLVPDLSNVRVSDGKGYTPVKNEDHLSDDDDKHNKSNNSTRYIVYTDYTCSKIPMHLCHTNVRFISYSKSSIWRRISKLSFAFGWGKFNQNSNLHICNLWTGQFVSLFVWASDKGVYAKPCYYCS